MTAEKCSILEIAQRISPFSDHVLNVSARVVSAEGWETAIARNLELLKFEMKG